MRPVAFEPESEPPPPQEPASPRGGTSSQPSIIVDLGVDVNALVEELCRSGPDDEAVALHALIRSGEPALIALTRRFPGPLWYDRHRHHHKLPAGRDVSAIARAFAVFGDRAVPYLGELAQHTDIDTRFYTALVCSDQVRPALLPVLARLLFDRDAQTRLIARDALCAYDRVTGFDEVVDQLRERAANTAIAREERMAALDALSQLRDPKSIPLLIELSQNEDRQLSVPAHRGLVAITGQDFGAAMRKWHGWYEEHRREHRIVWLVESLLHNEERVRAIAGVELQKLTQVYYGYVAGGPKKDRERAQRRYRDWWQNDGRRKFG